MQYSFSWLHIAERVCDIMSDSLVYELGTPSSKAGTSYDTAPVAQRFATIEGITYPCVYIDSCNNVKRHLLQSLSNLVSTEAAEVRYPVYFECNNEVSLLGSIDSKTLGILLGTELFSSWEILVAAGQDTIYTDDMRLAYCSY